MSMPLFRQAAVNHQQDRLHGEVLVVPRRVHLVLALTLLLWVVAAVVFLMQATYARQETVSGWLEPSEGVLRVFPRGSVGTIKQILVSEGDRVSKGQPLLIVNGDRMLTNGDSLEVMLLDEYAQQRSLLDERLIRITSMHAMQVNDSRQQLEAAEADLARLDEQLVTLNERKRLLDARYEKHLVMHADGHISSVELDATAEQILILKSEIQSLQRSKVNQQNKVEQLSTQLQLLPEQHFNQRAEIKRQLSDIAQQIAQLHGRRAYVVKAGREGLITNLQAQVGQQTQPNVPLLTVVPENKRILATLLVPVRAVGFVEPGQSLDIRYDAYPFQKFGIQAGEVLSVSDAVLLPNEVHNAPVPITEPVYLVKAKLGESNIDAYGTQMPLRSGMTFSADIQLSSRTLMEWLLEPLYSLKGRL